MKLPANYNYFPRYSTAVFASVFIIIAFFYNYHEILFKPPQSIHQWRQCDCLSITLNYHQDNNAFFQPSIHNLGRDGTGKTVSDFPLAYWVVAQLWDLFGQHEFIHRLLVLCFYFFGLFAVFKLFEMILHDTLVGLFASLLLFSSPTLVYYANNFLMNIPALSLALVGLFFFFRFYSTGKNKYLILMVICYAIAGLLKISSLLSYFAIVFLFLIELLGAKLKPERKIFTRPVTQGILLLAVVLMQLAWYWYAHHYNSLYNAGVFLVGILPIWKMSAEDIQITLETINEHLRWSYFRSETVFVIFSMLLILVVFYRKTRKIILWLALSLAFGVLLFCLLFFGALKDHDYYVINLFIIVPVVLLGFFVLLKDHVPVLFNSFIFKIILFIFLIHNIDFARRRIDGRYHPDGWQNSHYTHVISHFREIRPFLDSIGISSDDKVLSLSDNSINITLYLMNQKGWTNYGIESDSVKIREKINLGAKYILTTDDATIHDSGVRPFVGEKLGRFRTIEVFEIRQ
jgi:hypothetical protein